MGINRSPLALFRRVGSYPVRPPSRDSRGEALPGHRSAVHAQRAAAPRRTGAGVCRAQRGERVGPIAGAGKRRVPGTAPRGEDGPRGRGGTRYREMPVGVAGPGPPAAGSAAWQPGGELSGPGAAEP